MCYFFVDSANLENLLPLKISQFTVATMITGYLELVLLFWTEGAVLQDWCHHFASVAKTNSRRTQNIIS